MKMNRNLRKVAAVLFALIRYIVKREKDLPLSLTQKVCKKHKQKLRHTLMP